MNIIAEYTNGNILTTLCSDGTRIKYTDDDEFVPAFAECIDVNLSTVCDGGCQFCYINASPNGKHGNIANAKWIDTLHPFQEVALNINDMSHPDLIPLLEKLKSMNVVANVTINQKHFMRHYDVLKELSDKNLVYGVGVSLVEPTDDFIDKVKSIPNTVIHTINGILTAKQIEAMADKGLKLLILGYKHLERGIDYHRNNQNEIEDNQRYLYENIDRYFKRFKVVSFDGLSIEQLDVKRFLSDEEYEEIYAGSEGEFTFFLDTVTETFGINSLVSAEDRIPIDGRSVDEMFQIVRKMRN